MYYQETENAYKDINHKNLPISLLQIALAMGRFYILEQCSTRIGSQQKTLSGEGEGEMLLVNQ
jgi:hypothetical protein